MEESKSNTKKEYNKNYNKIYYEANKQKLSSFAREKVPCMLCNKMVARDYLKKHQKTKQCLPCITVDDIEKIKNDKKIKKINELNEYINEMNKLYNTNVKLFESEE